METLFVRMGLEEAAIELFEGLDRSLQPKVRVDAVSARASGMPAPLESERHISFASEPIVLDGARMRVVLQLSRFIFHAYYTLRRKKLSPGFETVVSLLEAAAQEFLHECPDAIRAFEGERLVVRLPRTSDEILRGAARRLMLNPMLASGYGEAQAGRLFFDCNSISYLRYEREASSGRLLLARHGHPNVQQVLTRHTPLPMSEHRAVRKLLELASGDTFVYGDGHHVFGLARITGRYDHEAQDLFSVRFMGQSNWELYHGLHLMMRVVEGLPDLPDIQLEGRFKRSLRSLFPTLSREVVAELWRLAQEASLSRRGAVLVVSEAASAEAERLESSCTRIEPLAMTGEMMSRVCSIDGAVLLDTAGRCHGIGAILDGVASPGGDPGRGARYNSAVRYVSSVRHACLVAVVSEDGGMEVLTSEGRGTG
jgi:hypothetical protein